MAILITHGYLLTGTGSNLYVNNLVRELVKKGEEVILVCQDFAPIEIDYINEVYNFNAENDSYKLVEQKESPYPGVCRCFVPNLNGFLPVYVYDHYEGFEVKEFNSCSDSEVQSYVEQNHKAMDVILKNFKVEVINTNHLVMFPYVAKLLKEDHAFKFVITVHGSALNFTVKKDKRFENFAIESLKVVDEIVVDSLHADEEMKEFLHDVKMEGLIEKMEIIPAGVDVGSFEVANASRNTMKKEFIESIEVNVAKSEGRDSSTTEQILTADLKVSTIDELVESVRGSYDYRHIDKDAIKKIEGLNLEGDNVFFVGKYLWTKGIYLILLGIPEILKKNPETNFIISGFGPFREPAELIINYLASNDLDGLLQALKTEKVFHGEDEQVLPLAISILENHKEEMSKNISSLTVDVRDKIVFTGIINHAQLVNLLPAMDVLIAPSVFPEAFGMVAIEAAACGVYPVITYQSAFKEIADEVKGLVSDQVVIRDVYLDENASTNIAKNTLAYLDAKNQMSSQELQDFKGALRKLVVDNYSWEGISSKYLKIFSKP